MATGKLLTQANFHYSDMAYRVQVFDSGEVWVERQFPRAFGGNIPMPQTYDDVMYGGMGTWRLDAIAPLLDKYEELYNKE